MASLTFKLMGDSRKVNTLRQVIKSKLPVLVLQKVTIATNTTQYDNQYIEDRFGNLPINSLSPALVGTTVRLKAKNTTQEMKMVTTADLEAPEPNLFVPTELRTYDGVVHSLPIELLDLLPDEAIELTCTIAKALTGDNGRYVIAPVCHFKGVMDEAAASKAYDQLPEEMKTDEHRKNWEMLYSHQHTVPNAYTFSLEVIPTCGYTNASAIAAACDIIVDNITASRMWKVNLDGEDPTHVEIVMDEYVGYLFESALFGKAGVDFVKYGKRHPHDATGTLRVKTSSGDVDITKLIQEVVEPLRRFYTDIAATVGGKRLHPQLQKALDAFKRTSVVEKRERLIELGVDRVRAESADEGDLDTMAEVWLRQTERKATRSLDSEDDVTKASAEKEKTEEEKGTAKGKEKGTETAKEKGTETEKEKETEKQEKKGDQAKGATESESA